MFDPTDLAAVELAADAQPAASSPSAEGAHGREAQPSFSSTSSTPARSEAEVAEVHEGRRPSIAQLRAVMARLAEALTLEDAARVLVGEAVEMLGASACAIGLLDDTGEQIQLVAYSGMGSESVDRWRSFPITTELPLATAMRTGEPVWLETREALLAAYPITAEARMSPEHLQAAVALPLSVRRSTVGAVTFSFAEAQRFDGERRDYLLALAHQGAAAFERARLQQAAEVARAEAEAARGAAEAATRAKDEFLAMLGHELRNPLAPIVTALQLMRLRGGEQTFGREIKVVQRQVDHLVRLVDDLLDVSRITRGKLQLKRTPIELSLSVQRAVEMASPLLEQRGHRLELRVPAEGLLVDADLERLAQVFANLLTNAARYTDPGGRITLEAEPRGGSVEVRVRDNGMGITPEALPRIFELFEQGGRSLDRSQGGLGLGLSIVRSVTQLHGGTVSARSDGAGHGSEFTVILPAFDASAPSQALPGRAAAPRAGAGRRLRMLMVDDNRDAIDMLAEGLQDEGHEVQVAYDPLRALDLLQGFEPDVLVLDIGLPVMDGYELARRIRQIPRLSGARIIAITGYGQESDRARALAAGFDEHLVKPVSLDTLKSYLPAPGASERAERPSEGTGR